MKKAKAAGKATAKQAAAERRNMPVGAVLSSGRGVRMEPCRLPSMLQGDFDELLARLRECAPPDLCIQESLSRIEERMTAVVRPRLLAIRAQVWDQWLFIQILLMLTPPQHAVAALTCKRWSVAAKLLWETL